MYASTNYPNSFLTYSGFAPLRKEQGAVLILALLIVSLVAGLGIKFAGDYQLGLARAEGRWHGAQARAYSFSAEGVALTILSKDSTPQYDSNDEPWKIEMPIEVEGGTLLISTNDANSQLNLNSLGHPLDPNKFPLQADRYDSAQRMFIRLLQLFPELVRSPEDAAGILEAIVDWADSDDQPSGSYGAEMSYYLGLPDPYQPANVGFRSVEELQLVRGITPELMRALRPYVTVLNDSKGLNVNTMEPLLYRCINKKTELKPLEETGAAALRPAAGEPYKSIAEFDAATLKVFGEGEIDKENLAISTDLFWLKTQAEIGDQRRVARSLLARGMPLFKVVRREELY